MVTLIIFLIVLGLLVFVHELGHFMVARRNGIKAEEFGFGFPPRLAGIVWDDETKKWKFVRGNREISSPHTIYSLNWIPLGGFVRIKGEDGEDKSADSFAQKSGWTRIKVLAAGVVMNFIFAWVLISIVFMMGFPRLTSTDSQESGTKTVKIVDVKSETPAEAMGLRLGDTVLLAGDQKVTGVAQVQEYIASHKGKEITFRIKRGEEEKILKGVPRVNAPAGEGALGIALDEGNMEITRYPWYQAIWEGLKETGRSIAFVSTGLYDLVKGLFIGDKASLAGVSGPVGIARLTGQVSDLGLVYLLYFTALLSVNLGIINILPFPALDGGRVLFVLIEMIKGSPVSQRVEGIFHQVGFALLLFLMLLVTVHDVSRLRIFEKIFG